MPHLDALGERDGTREASEPALAHNVALLVPLGGQLTLAGDVQDVVADLDVDVLLVDAGELERRGNEVLLLVLVDVNPECLRQ